MKYEKPKVVAQTSSSGSFAAGCPAQNRGPWPVGPNSCINCERTQ